MNEECPVDPVDLSTDSLDDSDLRNDSKDDSGEADIAGLVTFPMRPEYISKKTEDELHGASNPNKKKKKKKVLVRKRKPNLTVDAGLQSAISSNQTSPVKNSVSPSKKKEILVARSVSCNKILSKTENTEDDIYTSPFGPVSPVKNRQSARESKEENKKQRKQNYGPRQSNSGKTVPYSLIGDIEDYLHVSRITEISDGSKTDSNRSSIGSLGSRASRKISMQQIMKMRSMVGNLQGRRSVSPTSFASTEEFNSVDEKESECLNLSKEEYLEKVRQVARENAMENSMKAEKSLKAAHAEKMKQLPLHLQVAYDRQVRALKVWEEWQKEWNMFKISMCKRMNKTPSELILSRATEYRQRMEEYQRISAATPHHEKHGNDYWMMSLRGMGTRYVAVGNIFSGLFCPVRENAAPDLEVVRVSPFRKATLAENSTLQELNDQKKKKTWRDAPVLQRRKRQLHEQMRKLRTKALSEEDVPQLGIKGENLFEWAYVSNEKRAYEIEEGTDKERERFTASQTPDMSKVESNGSNSLQNGSDIIESLQELNGPSIDMHSRSGWASKSQDGTLRLVLQCHLNSIAVDFVEVKNTGSTSLFYTWTRETNNKNFLCDSLSGVILPGDEQKFSFAFKSANPGCWNETWNLSTKPEITDSQYKLITRGVSIKDDENEPKRAKVKETLENVSIHNSIRDMVCDIVRDVKTPEKVLSEEEAEQILQNCFESANRPLGLFYHASVSNELKELAGKIFVLLHSGHIASDSRNQLDRVKVDLDTWLANPSLIVLGWCIKQIQEGFPLNPESLAPTIPAGETDSFKASVCSPSVTSGDGMLLNIPAVSGDDTVLTPYKSTKLAELKQQAKVLEQELLRLATSAAKRPIEKSENFQLARSCLLGMADVIVNEDNPDENEENTEEPVETNEETEQLSRNERILEEVDSFEETCKTEENRSRQLLIEQHNLFPSIEDFHWLTDASPEMLKGKRVILRTDLDVLPSRDDPSTLDELETERRLKYAINTIGILSQALVSSIIIIARRGSENESLSLEPITEELGSRLGREVLFFDDCIGEEAVASLVLDEEEQEEETDIASPDDVPVYLLESLGHVPAEKAEDSSFVKTLESYADIFVEDSLAQMRFDSPSLGIGEGTDALKFFGPNIQADISNLDNILHSKHVFLIGGDEPKEYPEEVDTEQDSDSDSDDDDEVDGSSSGSSSNDTGSYSSESGTTDNTPHSDTDSATLPSNVEKETDGSTEDTVVETIKSMDSLKKESEGFAMSDASATESVKEHDVIVKADDILQTDFGFADQIRQINFVLDLKIASEILLIGPIAEAMRKAVSAMGEVSHRLFANATEESKIIDLAINPESVCSSFDLSSHKARENEMLRLTLEKARRGGVPIYLPLENEKETRKEWKKVISRNSSIVLAGNSSMHTNSSLLRFSARLAKSGEFLAWTANDAMSNSLEFLILNIDDLEEESDEEDENPDAEEDEEESGNEDEEKAKEQEEENNAEEEDVQESFDSIELIRNGSCLQHILNGNSFQGLHRVASAEAAKAKAQQDKDTDEDTPEE